MEIYNLPREIMLQGECHRIRCDFRPIFDILIALEDNELTDIEKMMVLIEILYIDKPKDNVLEDAIVEGLKFINLGQEIASEEKNAPRLLSYKQDAIYIFSAVDGQLGFSSRSSKFLHWWEFMGAFMNIGECFLSTLMHQRKLKAEGKHDKKWWSENKHIAEIKSLKEEQDEILKILNGW